MYQKEDGEVDFTVVVIDADTPREQAAQLTLQSVCWPNEDENYEALSGKEWIFARSNAISRSAEIRESEAVSIAGDSIVRSGVCIHSDLARVRLGRYCDIGREVTLRPSRRSHSQRDAKDESYLPMTIGSHVRIGRCTLVEAAWIGLGVRIGPGAVIGKCCIIKDFCVIAAGAILPDDSVCAPLSIVAGVPARTVGFVSPGATAERRREAEMHIRRTLANKIELV
uniref:Dynactin subunit 5 n=1 Tax=Aureoumbra lagunensis TaxID=44058 RepID=A0A7S3NH08_9STRA|mmetsp:Transcript_6445/g.9057  ORF Transcript_6445/g.9057 Transcript_6445/m.9057 type:complete len:225 (+) Transcript_6445:67-741(+)|eukprot:CAMPEP_0197327592 /NCGR_PEP_ID=MMETSP0892-20130614/3064_1 /TAXON_ID=44058 ORGANISM="Aureoumbra lagunensis, Strain CCMP1510" /NCGR_SAMPLE_ID=MMETSP0892 /ASSEMBLY_ACC=CAM_ASM_000538 /LENGTH=224 /DNA_ID=CAMNT_0042822525 /DNA_START=45 /DNA_END=719 /DNA_ORIENTATION=+